MDKHTKARYHAALIVADDCDSGLPSGPRADGVPSWFAWHPFNAG